MDLDAAPEFCGQVFESVLDHGWPPFQARSFLWGISGEKFRAEARPGALSFTELHPPDLGNRNRDAVTSEIRLA
jgi:hypothetical protein